MPHPHEGDARELGTKALGPMQVVDDAKGEVTAVVYSLGAVDRDRDVILPDAFASGIPVQLSNFGHSLILAQQKGTGAPVEAPVGKGVLTIEGGQAVFRGSYFMSTHRGREAFATTKEMGPDQQWSFSYWIDKKEPATGDWAAKGARMIHKQITPFEVSPVTVASSFGTYTVGVKCDGCGHSTEEPCDCGTKQAAAQAEADAKAAADLELAHLAERTASEAAERATQEAELATKAAADREAERQEDARVAARATLRQAAAEERERFQRNLKRFGRA
jgi:hypothetical protein